MARAIISSNLFPSKAVMVLYNCIIWAVSCGTDERDTLVSCRRCFGHSRVQPHQTEPRALPESYMCWLPQRHCTLQISNLRLYRSNRNLTKLIDRRYTVLSLKYELRVFVQYIKGYLSVSCARGDGRKRTIRT